MAQAHYYNLDGGRPGRVEDAEPEARYALDFDLAPFQFEHLTGGTNRYRVEPRLNYGVLPFTEIELRAPYVRMQPPRSSGARAVAGAVGLSVGVLHAFNLETAQLPAIAVASEVSFPVGALAPQRTSFLVKALVTKTTDVLRLHLNAGGGTYAVHVPSSQTDTACAPSAFRPFRLPGSTGCDAGPPIIIDTPCRVVPSSPGRLSAISARCMPAPDTTIVVSPRTFGTHWFGGLGADRAFALRSTVLTGDVFAERFVGLYTKTDWTAEVGMRHQLTPTLVTDAGAGWHFAGTIRSVSLVLGATYELATPPLLGR